uniref:Peptidyl-prolyl cis-trans isomerase n=1 Tax=Romanomermis culicivorax TaxID=13658 RepID=A0A915JLW1_ROMCU
MLDNSCDILDHNFVTAILCINLAQGMADTLEIIKCSMSFEIEGSAKPVDVVFELYPKLLPKTCANFLALCLGGLSLCGRKMQYKNSYLHEIVPDWCVVGGDFLNGNGTGGRSIFHGNEFEDESFHAVDYDQAGLLCMLSHGPNTNTSLFFVTLKPAEWINKLYVAFGKVVENLSGLRALAAEAGSCSGIPKKPVKILSCGPM